MNVRLDDIVSFLFARWMRPHMALVGIAIAIGVFGRIIGLADVIGVVMRVGLGSLFAFGGCVFALIAGSCFVDARSRGGGNFFLAIAVSIPPMSLSLLFFSGVVACAEGLIG